MAADAEATMANVREASPQAKAALANLQGEDGPVKGLTSNLQQTLTSARDVMSDMAETTEALKHNFLVRGFFTRRGYFDLADVSVDDYRQGVLENKERRALRLWIRAELLFERDAKGAERLSEGGRSRLDSAMSQFVRYPRTSPIVVEGYAQRPTADQRFLLSRSSGAARPRLHHRAVTGWIRRSSRSCRWDRGRGQPVRRHLGRRCGWPVRADRSAR